MPVAEAFVFPISVAPRNSESHVNVTGEGNFIEQILGKPTLKMLFHTLKKIVHKISWKIFRDSQNYFYYCVGIFMSLYLLTHPNSKSLAASGAFYFFKYFKKPFQTLYSSLFH